MALNMSEYRIVISRENDGIIQAAMSAGDTLLGSVSQVRWSALLPRIDAPLSRLETGAGNTRRSRNLAEPPPDLSPDLARVGQALWEMLFADGPGPALLEVLARADRQSPVALGFELPTENAFDLYRLPWAAIEPPDGIPLGLREWVYPFIKVPAKQPPKGPTGLPFRLAFAVSLPDSGAESPINHTKQGLDFENEEKVILQALKGLSIPPRLGPVPPSPIILGADDGVPEEIGKLARQMKAQVLHLTGHGQRGKIIMEDAKGQKREVDGVELAGILKGLPDLQLVVLSECLSGTAGTLDSRSERLWPVAMPVAETVGMAVGMLWPILDSLASEWSGHFYRFLVEAGWSPLAAMGRARRVLFAWDRQIRQEYRQKSQTGEEKGLSAHLGLGVEWACPVIFVADSSGLLLNDQSQPLDFQAPALPNLAGWEAAREVGSFVGRRTTRRRLVRALLPLEPKDPEYRVLVLYGLGGIGKSALAANLIGRLSEQHFKMILVPGQITGATLLERLAAETKNQRLLDLMAHPLFRQDLAVEGNPDALHNILSCLDETQGYFCLVLDDFENNLDAPLGPDRARDFLPLPGQRYNFLDQSLGLIIDRLAAQPGFRIIITTRYRFNWPEKVSKKLETKVLEESLGGLSVWDAVKLTFRLPALQRSSDGTTYTLDKREDLVKRLGRHPRALEFLNRLLESLETASPGQPARQDWSVADKVKERVSQWRQRQDLDWNRMAEDEEEQERLALSMAAEDILIEDLLNELGRHTGSDQASVLLRRLTLFQQPFHPQALRIMADPAWFRSPEKPDQSPDKDPTNNWAATMVDLGLLHLWKDSPAEEQFYMPPLLLTRLLQPREDLKPLHRAAADYYRVMIGQGSSRGQLLMSYFGLRHHCLAGGDGPCAAEASKPLVTIMEESGIYTEARRLALEVLQAKMENDPSLAQQAWLTIRAVRCGQIVEGAPAVKDELNEFINKMETEAQGKPLENLEDDTKEYYGPLIYLAAIIESSQGNYEEARRLLKEAIDTYDALGDRQGRAASLHLLAQIEYRQGNYEEARRLLKEAIDFKDALGDRQGRAATLHQLAIIESSQGNYEEARRLLKEAIDTYDALGDRQGRAASLHQLAIIEYSQGNYEEARRLLKETIDTYDALGDCQGRPASLHQLAIIEYSQGNYEEARRLLKKAIDTYDALGDRKGRAASLHMLAQIESSQGNYEEARRMLKEAIDLLDALGDRQGRATSLAQLGIWETDEGNTKDGTKHLWAALQVFESINAPLETAQVRGALAPLVLNGDPVSGLGLAWSAARDLEALGHSTASRKKKEFLQMAESVRKALEDMLGQLDEPNPRLFCDLGLVHLFLGKWEAAEKMLKKARELTLSTPSMITARASLGLARALRFLGKNTDEIRPYEGEARQLFSQFGQPFPALPGDRSGFIDPMARMVSLLALAADNVFQDPARAVKDVHQALNLFRANASIEPEIFVPLVLNRVLSGQAGFLSGLMVLDKFILLSGDGGPDIERLKQHLKIHLKNFETAIINELNKGLNPQTKSAARATLAMVMVLLDNPEAAAKQAQMALEQAQSLEYEIGQIMAQTVLNRIGLTSQETKEDND